MPTSREIRSTYLRDGFVILRGVVDEKTIARARKAVEKPRRDAQARGREAGQLVTREQAILQPQYLDESFVKIADDAQIQSAMATIIPPQQAIFAGLAVLFDAHEVDTVTTWGRDFSESAPDFQGMLANPDFMLIYNMPLYDDFSFWFVRGSHTKETTRAQRRHLINTGHTKRERIPASEVDPANYFSGMPDAVQIKLHAGDVVIYSAEGIQATFQPAGLERATFHGGVRNHEALKLLPSPRWGFEHNPWLQEPRYLRGISGVLADQVERYNAWALAAPGQVPNLAQSKPHRI